MTNFDAWLVSQIVKYIGRSQFMNTKQWWLSKTLWGIVIAIIATGLQMTGVVSISDIEQAGLVDRLIVIADLLAQLFGFILAIYGRVAAKHAIGSK